MGTITEKLSKVLETKSAIKNAIVNKGVDVTDDDTFSSYAEKIEQIESGTAVNTKKLGLTIDNFLGDVDDNGVLQAISEAPDVDFTGVKEIGENSLVCTFAYKNINSVNVSDIEVIQTTGMDHTFSHSTLNNTDVVFENLTEIKQNGLQYTFEHSNITSLEFPGITQIIRDNADRYVTLNHTAEYCKNLNTISFPNLERIESYQNFTYMANQSTVTNILFPKLKYISSVEKPSGSTSSFGPFNQAFYGTNNMTSFEFPSLEEVGPYGLYGVLNANSKLGNVGFPKLHTIRGKDAFAYAIANCTALTKVTFPSLKYIIDGNETFASAFNKDKNLTSIEFPELEEISGYRMFANWVSGCPNITEISFPKLKKITSTSTQGPLYYFASSNTYIEAVNFPLLEELAGTYTLSYAFNGNTKITKIDFPNLKTISGTFVFGQSSASYAFSGCTALTEIHFRSDMQERISSLLGYADKWGATNATIYFDL